VIYSCFDPKAGLYDYYEGPDTHPINADLPLPTHLPPEIPGIGVPSIDAARPLPSGTKLAGKGWHARGMVVSCGKGPLGAFLGATPVDGWKIMLAFGIVSLVTYYSLRGPKRRRAS